MAPIPTQEGKELPTLDLKNRKYSLDVEGAQAQPVSRPAPAPSITPQATPQPTQLTPTPSPSATPSPTPQPTATPTPTPTPTGDLLAMFRASPPPTART